MPRGRTGAPEPSPWQTALHDRRIGRRRSGRSLLALGADPGIHDKHPDSTPLGWARYFEREQFVQLLEPITSSTFSSPGP